ncbi:MAG TPA: site-specific integrase [Pseudonocardiaceae bacterium]|jgi:integrase|nr:site-specific integrase [Pseudonocardiaceae bacterium]
MPRTRANGEGSISKRRDGRYEAAAWVATVSGKRKRIRTYATTRESAHERLIAQLTLTNQGIPAPDRPWRLGAYLDYWLRDVVPAKTRPRTLEQYEAVVRRYLKPYLGTKSLTKLSVVDVQSFLNDQIRQGRSVRSIHLIRSVLRAALSRAQREELVARNVAKLVEIPAWQRKPIRPWSAEDATAFLAATEDHRLYPAFVMLLLYGMRRGEVLGLRWCDVDFAHGQLHIQQQLQRIGTTLQQGPVKTSASRRDLPLIGVLREALIRRYAMSRFQPGREVLVDKGCGSRVDVCRSVGVTTR